jgi:hypothetical protein
MTKKRSMSKFKSSFRKKKPQTSKDSMYKPEFYFEQFFLTTGKEEYTFNTLNIPPEEFHPFRYFHMKDQKIILDVLKGETSIGRYEKGGVDLQDFEYYMGGFTEDILPATYLDVSTREGYWKKHGEEFRNEMIHISRFMREIIEEGIQEPILIAETFDRRIIGIGGGHHRVQAVRELIRIGLLPKDFIIPVVVIRPLEKGMYRKYWSYFDSLERQGLIET